MKRINTTLTKVILGLALSSLTLTSCGKQTDSGRQSNNKNIVKLEDRPLSLTQFEQIHGTRYMMAEIVEGQAQRSLSSSSSSGNGQTRNLVFLDGDSLASHRLFDTNAYVILSTTQYPNHDRENDLRVSTVEVLSASAPAHLLWPRE